MTADEYSEWCLREQAKPRTMTLAEYKAWCLVGDEISSPTSANAFPGGLTIILGEDSGILGKTK